MPLGDDRTSKKFLQIHLWFLTHAQQHNNQQSKDFLDISYPSTSNNKPHKIVRHSHQENISWWEEKLTDCSPRLNNF